MVYKNIARLRLRKMKNKNNRYLFIPMKKWLYGDVQGFMCYPEIFLERVIIGPNSQNFLLIVWNHIKKVNIQPQPKFRCFNKKKRVLDFKNFLPHNF